MSLRAIKWVAGVLGAIGAVIYAAFLSAPYDVLPDGTVAGGGGMGRAIEMLAVGAVIYWIVRLVLQRRASTTDGGQA